MKSILHFVFLSIVFSHNLFGQKNFIENGKLNGILPLDELENVTYRVIKPVEGVSKDELYKRARKWFVTAYNSPKDVLQLSDSSTGELTGNGYFAGKARIAKLWFTASIAHTVQVELKDNRYRITLNDIKINNQTGRLKDFKLPYIATTQNHYTALYASIDEQCKGLVASLEKALATADDF